MNERVKELIWKADQYSISNVERGRDSEFFHTIAMNKLAELIVRECATFLMDTMDDHFAAEQLKEHFGVEE